MIKAVTRFMTAAVLLLLVSFSQAWANSPFLTVVGNGKMVEQTRELGAFTKINAQNNINLQLISGKKFASTVRTDQNIMQYVMTEVKHGELIVRLKDNVLAQSDHDITVTIQVHTLKSIRHHGSGDIDGHGIKTQNLVLQNHGAGDIRLSGHVDLSSLDVSGSGDIQIENALSDSLTIQVFGEADIEMRGHHIALKKLHQAGQGDIIIKGVKTDALTVLSQGSGDARLTGSAKTIMVRVNGSADLDASNLATENADVNVTGSGDIQVHGGITFKADILGSGDITYYGEPKKLAVRILGSGRIHQHA